MKNIVCPVSSQRVDEHATRLGALVTILVVACAFVLNSTVLLALLVVDFFIRAFGEGRFSPIGQAGRTIARALALPVKPIDKAPKVFAARLGLLMTIAIASTFALNLKTASLALASLLVLFAGLEFVCAVCVGCLIYTYTVLPFFKNSVEGPLDGLEL